MIQIFLIQFFFRISDTIQNSIAELKDWRRGYFFRRPLMVSLAFLALFILTRRALIPSKLAPKLDEASYITFTGTITSQPDMRLKSVAYEVVRDDTSEKVSIEVVRGKITAAEPGDRIRVSGRLTSPSQAKIPNTFDYRHYLAGKNIHAVMYIGPSQFENEGPSGKYRWHRWGWRAHQFLVNIFERNLDGPSAAVLAGLVVGDRPHQQPHVKKIFVQTGTMHILVASGSNMAFVTALWFLLTRLLLKLARRFALLSSLPLIWFYALIVGLDAPIVRAAIMGTFAVLYYWFQKEDSPLYILSLTALVLLVIDPNSLFDVGFQMSFITVFGLIFWLPKIPWYSGVQYLTGTLCAQVWLWPIMTNVFKKIYPWGFLCNLIVLPLSMGGFFAGMVLVIADYFHMTLMADVIQCYLNVLIGVVGWLARHFGRAVWLSPWTGFQIAGYYVACICIAWLRKSSLARVVFLIGLVLVIFGFKRPEKARPDLLRLTWLDMGRRLSIIVEKSDAAPVVINPPKQDVAEKLLYPYAAQQKLKLDETRDIERGDYLIYRASHTVVVLSEYLPLKAQRKILASGLERIDILQTRFAKKLLWDAEFVAKYHPNIVIETGYNSAAKPSCPPWHGVQLIVPQLLGIWSWETTSP